MSKWMSVKVKSPRAGVQVMFALVGLTLAGCANFTTAGSYAPPKASSATDANAIATNVYATQYVQAPSQLQINLPGSENTTQVNVSQSTKRAVPQVAQVFKASETAPLNATSVAANTSPLNEAPPDEAAQSGLDTQAVATAAAPTPQEELMPEPLSFAGTVPCFNPNQSCTIQKVIVSFAPNGRWRARTTPIEQDKQRGKPLAEQGCWRSILGSATRISISASNGKERAQFAVPSENLMHVISVNGQTPNLNYSLSRQPDLDPINELDKAGAPSCN